ncbi:MAG TPA: TetR/AcrR family transcriptional regulator [Streptosporangiaceae bacterium]|jgi:AcrR family transcriptional regulator|nr:TetR/AcrR family transcriptional regulator [Streptosporangiaceae bacterium]
MVRVTAHVKETTRARLVAAAAQEFARTGFERANVDAISLAAGYAKGTIYNYFPSKEELFLAVVEEASAQAATTASAPAAASARERLAAALAGFCSWAGQQDPLARVLVRECLMGTPGLYPRVIGAEWPLTAALEAIIAEGVHDGELRGDVPADLLALALAGLTDLALAQHWASHGAKPTLAEIPALVLTLLLGPARTGNDP